MRLPQWYTQYKDQIHQHLYPTYILSQYAIHKPYCLTIDEDGKRHFPDHAAISQRTWEQHFGRDGVNGTIADLIGLDMIFHTEAADQIISRNLSPEMLCTLMISALAAIEAGREFLRPGDEHPSLIMCLIKGENKLASTAEKLREAGIRLKEFREPDIGNQLTAIATEPLIGEARAPLRHYQLLT